MNKINGKGSAKLTLTFHVQGLICSCQAVHVPTLTTHLGFLLHLTFDQCRLSANDHFEQDLVQAFIIYECVTC